MKRDFSMPDKMDSQAAQMSVRSRKVPYGFAGCCAIYFMGVRIGYGHGIGKTRSQAMRNAEILAGYRQIENALTLGSMY